MSALEVLRRPFCPGASAEEEELLSVTELPLEALLCGPLGEKRFEPCEPRRHHERWALRSLYLCARDVGGKSSPPQPLESGRREVRRVQNRRVLGGAHRRVGVVGWSGEGMAGSNEAW